MLHTPHIQMCRRPFPLPPTFTFTIHTTFITHMTHLLAALLLTPRDMTCWACPRLFHPFLFHIISVLTMPLRNLYRHQTNLVATNGKSSAVSPFLVFLSGMFAHIHINLYLFLYQMNLSILIGIGVLLLAAVSVPAEGSTHPNLRHEEANPSTKVS